jgi:hypothetical protein
MIKKSNKTAKRLAIIAGILLLLSGITGVGFVKSVENLVFKYITDNHLVILIFTILLFIASLGGLAVILGGILIGRGKVILGILLIKLGSGVGFLGLILNIFLTIYTKTLTISSFFSIGSLGIILAVIAPFYVKK